MGAVLVGTSGWHYPAGRGTWNGVFYPSRRPRGFDELSYYAEHFDTVEVNSTFYRMPEPGHAEAWLRRTPASFLFSVKLFQKFTHPDMYLARPGVAEWDLSRADVDLYRRGIDPLAEAGRLAAVLVQFPPSFHQGAATGEYVRWLVAQLSGYDVAVELRHRSWSDRREATQALLSESGATGVLIDEPKFSSSIRQELGAADGGLTYIRLHGRNAAAWWEHEAAEDRYDYLYAKEELEPFAEVAGRRAANGSRVLIYLNNHFSAKAVANAAILRHELDQLVPGTYPVEMVRRYPDLSGIVATDGLTFDP